MTSTTPHLEGASESTKVAEVYYDSDEADRFYYAVWGGEDIHVGLYDGYGPDIREASARTVSRMAGMLDLQPGARVLDLGAGYGGAARYLAREYGAHVTCVNLSRSQNRRNEQLTREQGLDGQVVVLHGNFEQLDVPAGSFDVVWSQDSFLHSGKRVRVLREARRALKPGGKLVFTDPMQADDCPEGVLQPILDRIHLDSLASFAFYRQAAAEVGLKEVACVNLTPELGTHYARVGEELQGRYEELCKLSGQEYVDRMLVGLQHWVDGEAKGYLAWGILLFERP